MKIGAWIWFCIIFVLSIGYIGAELGEQKKFYKVFMKAFNDEKVVIKEKSGLEGRIKKTKLILWIFFIVLIIVGIVKIIMPNGSIITPFNVFLFCPVYSIRSKERMFFVFLEDEVVIFGNKKPLKYKDIKYVELSSRRNNTVDYIEIELIDREYNETRFKVKLGRIEEVIGILNDNGIATSKVISQLESKNIWNIS